MLCLVLLAAGPAATADVETAKTLYEQARGEKDVPRRIKLLQDSLSAYETYEAHYALGEALYKATRFAAARVELAKAYEIAAHDRARARACYMVAETLLSEDDVVTFHLDGYDGRNAHGVVDLDLSWHVHPSNVVLRVVS